MQVDLDQPGLAHLTLDPDEQLMVQIGDAELTLIGGLAGMPALAAGPARAARADRETVALARPSRGGRRGVHPS